MQVIDWKYASALRGLHCSGTSEDDCQAFVLKKIFSARNISKTRRSFIDVKGRTFRHEAVTAQKNKARKSVYGIVRWHKPAEAAATAAAVVEAAAVAVNGVIMANTIMTRISFVLHAVYKHPRLLSDSIRIPFHCISIIMLFSFLIVAATFYKNLAIANRSRVSCAHNMLRASIGLNITPWPWNLG